MLHKVVVSLGSNESSIATADLSTAAKLKLQNILLLYEDAEELFVKATYSLEGDGAQPHLFLPAMKGLKGQFFHPPGLYFRLVVHEEVEIGVSYCI